MIKDYYSISLDSPLEVISYLLEDNLDVNRKISEFFIRNGYNHPNVNKFDHNDIFFHCSSYEEFIANYNKVVNNGIINMSNCFANSIDMIRKIEFLTSKGVNIKLDLCQFPTIDISVLNYIEKHYDYIPNQYNERSIKGLPPSIFTSEGGQSFESTIWRHKRGYSPKILFLDNIEQAKWFIENMTIRRFVRISRVCEVKIENPQVAKLVIDFMKTWEILRIS